MKTSFLTNILAIPAIAFVALASPSSLQAGYKDTSAIGFLDPDLEEEGPLATDGQNQTSADEMFTDGSAQGSDGPVHAVIGRPVPHDDGSPVENGWDFNKPDSIPGFSSMPHQGASERMSD